MRGEDDAISIGNRCLHAVRHYYDDLPFWIFRDNVSRALREQPLQYQRLTTLLNMYKGKTSLSYTELCFLHGSLYKILGYELLEQFISIANQIAEEKTKHDLTRT